MRRDGDLELQGRRRGDVDFELRPDVSLHRPDGTVAPPSESQVACAAAPGVSTTVDGIGAAAGGGPPISAWLPITRASLMCVKAVSLSARRSEPWYMASGKSSQHRRPATSLLHGRDDRECRIGAVITARPIGVQTVVPGPGVRVPHGLPGVVG